MRENLFLNPVAAGLSLFSFLSPGREESRREGARRSGRIAADDPTLPIEFLLGGNQQKVVVGRWLHLEAKIYVFEDPTAGVDVGAKAEIYRLFDVALQAGAAIIIVSTDFEEAAKVCHRAIFNRGRVVAELPPPICRWRICLRPPPPVFGDPRRLLPPPPVSPGGGAHAVH